jgi:hypothetical protein
MWPINGAPLKAIYETHQHVGSQCNCLCAKYGIHNKQVMLDHLLRSEDEKRAKEAKESKVRAPRRNMFIEGYQQHISRPLIEPPTAEEEEEDAKIDGLEDDILLKTIKDQLDPTSFLGASLNSIIEQCRICCPYQRTNLNEIAYSHSRHYLGSAMKILAIEAARCTTK